jgi:hypothetical protein
MNAPDQHPLHSAIMRAVLAADQVIITYANMLTEDEIIAAEDDAWCAKQAMYAEFHKLGISENLVRKIGSVV